VAISGLAVRRTGPDAVVIVAVGLPTGAWTEHATMGEENAAGIPAFAVATVGLSNRIAAGRTAVSGRMHGTINTIVVVDADPEPSALVNAIITVTGRGASARFGGPASELGWSIAQAARRALWAGIRGWQERNG
jgi:adenosylcobinamide amidohydrolase